VARSVLGMLAAILAALCVPLNAPAHVVASAHHSCRSAHGPRFCAAREQRVAIRRLTPAMRRHEVRTHKPAMRIRITWRVPSLKQTNTAIRMRITWLRSLPDWHPEAPLDAIHAAAVKYDVSESGMIRTASCESGLGRQRWPQSGSGASGLFQFIPGTWASTWAGAHGYSVWSNYWNAQMAARAVSTTPGLGAYPSDWHSRGWVCPV
jgi:hypothetical protein